MFWSRVRLYHFVKMYEGKRNEKLLHVWHKIIKKSYYQIPDRDHIAKFLWGVQIVFGHIDKN